MRKTLGRWGLCALWLAAAGGACAAPAQVRIEQQQDRYRLLVDGQPFLIKGAGLGDCDMAELAARGGNSFRTWRTDPDPARQLQQLDRAQALGLRVALGLQVGNERHGFDYDDAAGVERQLQRLRAEVLRYKDHPAVLMWVVGNELNLDYRNPKVWNAVGAIADMIHSIDPNHPVTTTLAGFDRPLIDLLKTRAPSLDLIAVQLYGDISELPQKLRDSAWTGPYVVTEWGPTGHWESPTTAWGAPIEEDSAHKADRLLERYRRYIGSDTRQGLGSYVFLWGDKQERTPTWYGLFLPSGETTPSVDAMQYLWTGTWPAQRAPRVSALTLDGKDALASVTLKPQARVAARVQVQAGGAGALRYRWRVLEESTATSIGGDPESVPPEVAVEFADDGNGGAQLSAPRKPGHYRLFVEAHDGHGHAGYANLPFRVEAP